MASERFQLLLIFIFAAAIVALAASELQTDYKLKISEGGKKEVQIESFTQALHGEPSDLKAMFSSEKNDQNSKALARDRNELDRLAAEDQVGLSDLITTLTDDETNQR